MASLDSVFSAINTRLQSADASKPKTNEHVYKYIITGENGEVLRTWLLNLSDGTLVEEDGSAEVTFTLTESMMLELGTGKLSTADGIERGKVKVSGDMSIALLLGQK